MHASEMSPVADDLQNIQTRILGVLPDFGKELGQVEMNLNNLKFKTDQDVRAAFDFDVGNQDAQKIIEEAAMIVENRTKMKFPDIPNNESSQG
jgi:division protein CdvB (Snf7/Vps24/ESCRT-III family)